MNRKNESPLRKALLLSATTLAALGVAISLPVKNAFAAPMLMKVKPVETNAQRLARILRFAPKHIAPNTLRLLGIADRALSDNLLAERIFSNPNAVAVQYHLSKNETNVLRHMDRLQFDTARKDAMDVVAKRKREAGDLRLPPDAVNVHLITERMIVGRAILAAVGRSYLDAANAHDCCPWNGGVSLGISSDPAFYNSVFNKPAGTQALPAVQTMRPNSEFPANRMKVMQPGQNIPQ